MLTIPDLLARFFRTEEYRRIADPTPCCCQKWLDDHKIKQTYVPDAVDGLDLLSKVNSYNLVKGLMVRGRSAAGTVQGSIKGGDAKVILREGAYMLPVRKGFDPIKLWVDNYIGGAIHELVHFSSSGQVSFGASAGVSVDVSSSNVIGTVGDWDLRTESGPRPEPTPPVARGGVAGGVDLTGPPPSKEKVDRAWESLMKCLREAEALRRRQVAALNVKHSASKSLSIVSDFERTTVVTGGGVAWELAKSRGKITVGKGVKGGVAGVAITTAAEGAYMFGAWFNDYWNVLSQADQRSLDCNEGMESMYQLSFRNVTDVTGRVSPYVNRSLRNNPRYWNDSMW